MKKFVIKGKSTIFAALFGDGLVLTASALEGKHAGPRRFARKTELSNNQLPKTTMHSLLNLTKVD